MITYALGFALVCFGLGLILNLWRLAIGPTVADRVLALDTMVINVIGMSIPGVTGRLSFMSIRWFPPGLSSSIPPGGITYPAGRSCMTMPASAITTSCIWTTADSGLAAPTMRTVRDVVLVTVPNAEVMPSSAAFTQPSRTVRGEREVVSPGLQRGVPEVIRHT